MPDPRVADSCQLTTEKERQGAATFARLDHFPLQARSHCERVPDAATRASLLGVATTLDEAWLRGERLPVLRAHRKRLERALKGSRNLGAADDSA